MSDTSDTPDPELLRRLREAAERVPAGPVARRIAGRDYRVQRSLPRPMLTAGATAMGLAAAGAVLVLALSTGASPAFAGWTAIPTTDSEAQIAQAESTCKSAVARFQIFQNELDEKEQETQASEEREKGSSRIQSIGAQTHDTAWQPYLIDTRGPYTVFDFRGTEDGAEAFCYTGEGTHTFASIHPKNESPPAVKAGSAISEEGAETNWPGEGDFQMQAGYVGEGVTAIVYHLANGTNVSASIGNGRFLVWWPVNTFHTVTVGGRNFRVPVQEVTSTSITNSKGTRTYQWPHGTATFEEF